jgi:hypothetical protein
MGPYDTKLYVCDHIDGNPLNNTRDNLRLITRSQNAMNSYKKGHNASSTYKGVTKRRNKWTAHLQGKYLGTFQSETDAANAYNLAAHAAFGDIAILNVIPTHSDTLQK